MPGIKDRLERISSGFMPARVLITALELDLFTAIGNEALPPARLARKMRVKRDPLERLMNALVALKILSKQNGLYANTQEGLQHLTADAPDPRGDIIRHRASMWESWSQLTDIVRTGRVKPHRKTKKREKRFMKGMANIGAGSALETVAALKKDLKGAKRLLDVGGGPAAYACEFARQVPGLTVTVLDLPGPLNYGRETIRRLEMAGRVKVKAADALKVSSYGKGYDVVFLSNFIHCFKREVAEKITRKAARAVRKGGNLIVKEFYIERDGTAPPFAALFSVNMLVVDAGDCFSRRDVEEWMTLAGVQPRRFAKVAQHSGLLVGVKL